MGLFKKLGEKADAALEAAQKTTKDLANKVESSFKEPKYLLSIDADLGKSYTKDELFKIMLDRGIIMEAPDEDD
jgi:hypothetical protein